MTEKNEYFPVPPEEENNNVSEDDLSIPKRFVLEQIDDSNLTRNEVEAYRKSCQSLFAETILEDQEEKLVNRFKAILMLLRDKNTDERGWHIQIGKKIASKMKTGNIKTAELWNYRREVKKRWPEFEGSVVWDVLFPGEPYKQLSGEPDKIGEGLPEKKYKKLRERWWRHHAEKWGVLGDYFKRVTNGRGNHKKDDYIIPEPNFWKEAHKLYQKHGKKCLSSKDPNFPSEWMKKRLSGETSNLELVGYKRNDEDKKNPIRLKSKKIRELLGNAPDWWQRTKNVPN